MTNNSQMSTRMFGCSLFMGELALPCGMYSHGADAWKSDVSAKWKWGIPVGKVSENRRKRQINKTPQIVM